jgi:hypothetical protein
MIEALQIMQEPLIMQYKCLKPHIMHVSCDIVVLIRAITSAVSINKRKRRHTLSTNGCKAVLFTLGD